MSNETLESLRRRVLELEAEVQARESDLSRFRAELSQANTRLEQLISQLAQELKTVHAIQRILVPVEFPHISGFEFSTKFLPSMISGGDYFDIFEHQDRMRFGVMLASSSGHAMSALFLSVLLKSTGPLESRQAEGPDRLLNAMMKEIQPSMPPGARAEIFYGVVDRRNFQFQFSGCGSISAYHQVFGNAELKLLRLPPESLNHLGLPSVSSESLILGPRDRLIIASRGITESHNLAGEAYGQARLSRSILEGPKSGVHELRNHILVDLQRFTSGAEIERDQTLMVIEVKDKVIKLAKS